MNNLLRSNNISGSLKSGEAYYVGKNFNGLHEKLFPSATQLLLFVTYIIVIF